MRVRCCKHEFIECIDPFTAVVPLNSAIGRAAWIDAMIDVRSVTEVGIISYVMLQR